MRRGDRSGAIHQQPRALKVCDVTQFYAPRSGGVKRYLHEKIAFLQNTEHEHVLVVPGAETSARSEGRSRVYSIASPVVPGTGGYRALVNLRAVGEVLEREQPDVIESADPYQLGSYVARAAAMLRIPAVAFYHSHFYEAYFARCVPRPIAQAYVRSLYSQFAVTITASNALASTLRDWGVERVTAVGLGIDTSVFRPRYGALADNSSTVRLLYVGRLAAEKNVAALAGAVQELNRRQPGRFHVTIIGDGPERARIEALVASERNVTWRTYCADRAELAEQYRRADLFVHPGVRETFGLAALEAQACGTAVVGIAGTRMDEAILHDQSWWARDNNAAALADAIERATMLDLHGIGGAASRAVHARFSWVNVFERLFCIYREVCANYSAKPR